MAAIGVRVHGYAAAALLALAAPLGILAALRRGPFAPDLHLLAALGGLTLLMQCILYWYLPSFAKREVSFEGMASYSGPILFPATLVGAALDMGALRVGLPAIGLGIFGAILLLSPVVGRRWRSGVPFWRTPGPFQRGDRLSMMTLAAGALWLLLCAWLGFTRPTMLALVWPIALLTLVLGALAHYVPRGRGRAMLAAAYALGACAFTLGAALLVAERAGAAIPRGLPESLIAGLLVAGAAIAPPGAAKAAGARLGQAAPFLLAGSAAMAGAIVFSVSGRGIGFAFAAYYGLLAALALAVAGLSLLLLPVVFNERPDARGLWPSVGCALGGAALFAAGVLTRLPRWPGAALLAISVLCWLAMMAPLRRPRRDCPV
ncbi:MAG TPA: hypothetical protein VM370_06580 [Candidatus Thermoplasmatota archaeon]|nr:hypothetical protein [Candidatus Thermoplasmatota archaeon]